LLPETGAIAALEVAERLRLAIAEPHLRLEDGRCVNFTVSIGVTSLASPQDGIDDLLNRADQALYQAKHGGRNRVCLVEAEDEADKPDAR
ncbi:MAG: hypothetical protein RIR00_1341, partial [Pseudomonadota bacterium]